MHRSGSNQLYLLGKLEGIRLPRRWRVLGPLAAFLLAGFLASPGYHHLLTTTEHDENYRALQDLARDPRLLFEYGSTSHAAKLPYRIGPLPVLWLWGTSKTSLPIFFLLTALGVFLLFTQVLYRWTQDALYSLLATFLLAVTAPGYMPLVSDPRGIFDGYTFCWLLAACWTRRPWVMFLCLLLAFFSDERAVFASAFVFLLQVYRLPPKEQQTGDWVAGSPPVVRPWWRSPLAWWIVLTLPVYLLLRALYAYWLEIPYYQTGGITPTTVLNNLKLFPLALVLVLQAAWLPALAGLLTLAARSSAFQLGLALFSTTCTLFVGMAVFDLMRSLTYLLPFLVWSLVLLRQTHEPRLVRKLLLLAFLLSLLIPAYNISAHHIVLLGPLPVEVMRWLY